MPDIKLPRTPPEPLEGSRLQRHFEAIRNILWNQVQLSGGYSSTITGNAREFFVRDFLATHLPTCLRIGSGHVIANDQATGQLDVVVYRDTGLALPLGSSGVFFSESVLACMEVKSILKKDEFISQIACNFKKLPTPQPLKVVVAASLANDCQHRSIVAKWALDEQLGEPALPDLVIILDNSAIIRGKSLKCLSETPWFGSETGRLYKLGRYQNQKSLGLMLLVFELAQRAGGADWRPYLEQGMLNDTQPILLPD